MTDLQANTALPVIAERMRALESFIICGHISPDGDCLGSQLALYHALRALGKEATCLLVGSDTIDQGLRFLPGIDDMSVSTDFNGSADAFVTCDVPVLSRIGDAARIQKSCGTTIALDHHASEERIAELSYIDIGAASTTMIIWELIKHLGVELSADMALCAYTGLVTDTGSFQFQNTDPAAFAVASEMIEAGVSPSFVSKNVFQRRRLASLELERIALERLSIADDGSYALSYLTRADFERVGAVKADAEPLISVIRSLEDIHIACIVREDEGSIRGSLRAKDDIDVSAIARSLGGGGHRAAAGFTVYAPLDEALELVRERIAEALRAYEADAGTKGSQRMCGGLSEE